MRALIVLLLASAALSQSASRVAESVGLDYYQFWGVPVARRVADGPLGSPYRDGARYVALLREHTARLNQPRLNAVNGLRTLPDFAGSPLLYTVFAAVSSDYTFSLRLFQALQLVAFLLAIWLLGRLAGVDRFSRICLALLAILAYQPLLSDIRVANLGCFQLAYLAGLLLTADRLSAARSPGTRAALGGLFLSALVVFTLCKPNVLLVAVLLAAHLGIRHGRRVLAVSLGAAAAVAALGLALPCLYFGSWTVWREWYDFVYGANAHMLVRRVADGNYSTVVFLASWLRTDVYVVAPVLLGLLGLSLLVVATGRARGPGLAPPWAAARRLADDPQAALAIGLVLTLATAPLYWFHYYVLSLIPALWLVSAPGASRYPAGLATASVVMSSGMLGLPAWWLGWYDALPAVIALSWVPLWIALLLRLAPHDAEPARPAASEDAAPAERHAAAPPARRRRR